jgi:hypothetical protein
MVVMVMMVVTCLFPRRLKLALNLSNDKPQKVWGVRQVAVPRAIANGLDMEQREWPKAASEGGDNRCPGRSRHFHTMRSGINRAALE